jgi:aspartokinase
LPCLTTPGQTEISPSSFAMAAITCSATVLQERVRVFDANRGKERIVVLKLGGSVLTGAKAFRRAAQFLKQRTELAPDEKLVVVVSAQKLATDMLERRARRIVRPPAVRTLDLLWSTGELRSVALLALHLEAMGVSSVGLNVHETGLQFATEHENARARHLPSITFKEVLQLARRGCELVQLHALLAASEANLTLVIRNLDERAPFTVISRGSQDGNKERRNEPAVTEA